eukprot:112000-Amphidinium_carterae.1
MHSLMIRPAADSKRYPHPAEPVTSDKLQVAYNSTRVVSFFSLDGCLLTGFGLDLLAGKLSGPKVDPVTLQLVGVLLASILLP